ncbi:MAG TPA: NADPH-dependent FMN reductase [Thermoplasmata archaeon]|nr:NADPH-dependent FMN reductase [Thermoplasmata archaeon]
MSLYLPVIYGSVRANRKSIHVARYAVARLRARPGIETRLFDPQDLPFGNLVHREWEWKDAPESVRSFAREMERADGFILVTPEYNFGIPGTLKNLLDHLWRQWHFKPFGLVGAGGMVGGARAVDALRMVVPGLKGISVPTAVLVQHVETAFTADGPAKDREEWEKKFDRFFTDVEWYARALARARMDDPPPQR